VAYDLRADTRFQFRQRSMPQTAQTVIEFHRGLGPGEKLAVFFSSFAYAEAVLKLVAAIPDSPSAALQPRKGDLTSQAAWVEKSLLAVDILFLVLGSGFAEGVDLLGGRVHAAMVVGPALPEVNPVQRARLATLSTVSREHAVERVYRVPGMQKVNQALGRLVRAPGQKARILLHCVRFGESEFSRLLAPEYQDGTTLTTNQEFESWLNPGTPA
jgi:Rad3-related DNA helicase